MAMERKAKPMGNFFKFTEIGQMACGKVRAFRSSENGDFVILEPAIIRPSKDGKLACYATAPIGLSTDMLQKVDARSDVGKLLLFKFVGKEPTKKGSPLKVFEVLDLEQHEYDQLLNRSEDHSSEPYMTAPRNDATGDDPLADSQDDLPF